MCDSFSQESPVTFQVPIEETSSEALPPSGGISTDDGDMDTGTSDSTAGVGSVQE